MQTNQFSLLTTRRFLPLFITQFLGAFNDNVFKNAIVILATFQIITTVHYNLQLLLAMIGFFFILPYFLFSATAGQIADKYERSKLIVLIKCFEVLLMFLAMGAFYKHNIFLLTGVLFLLGIQATFFGPIKYAILPDHLVTQELVAGNALIESGTYLAILLGTILGGVLILTHHGILLTSLILIAVAISGVISSCFIPQTKNAAPSVIVNPNFFQETINILKYSWQFWDISLTIIGISWFWFFGALVVLEFPAYVKDVLHANQHVFTLFFTLFSLGIGIGSLLCNRLLKGQVNATYVPLGALGMTLFTIDLYFASKHAVFGQQLGLMGVNEFISAIPNWRIMFDLLFIAISGGIYNVPLYAILQHRSDINYRARIIAANNIMNALFMVVAALVPIVLLLLGLSIIQLFLVIGILNGLVALYICKLLPDALLKSFIKWALKLIFRVEVKGLDHYQQAGDRVVLVANHTSFLDAALLAAFMPDKLTFAVNTFTAKKWWIRLFLRMVDAFPLDPTNSMAIKSLIEYVEQDKKCVIFPEGRITVTGALMKIYEGPGMIADKSGAKLLPVRIDGAQLSHFSRLRGKIRLQWFPKITLTIAEPQSFAVPADLFGRKRRQVISRKLYDIMTEMLLNSSPYEKTLFSSLIAVAELYGPHHIIAEDIERKPLSYQQLIMRSFILGNIIARNSQHRDRIGVLLPNAVANMVTFFAMQAYGRVPAMLNFTAGAHQVLIACDTAQIKRVYTSRRFIGLAKLQDMVDQLQQKDITVIYLEDLAAQISLIAKLTGWLQAQFPSWTYHHINARALKRAVPKAHPSAETFNNISSSSQSSLDIKNNTVSLKSATSDSHAATGSQVKSNRVKCNIPDPHAPAVILFTSGSEGVPKGVVLSHANIQANRYQLTACVDFTPVDIAFNALPLFHSFGLTGGMILPVLSGIKIFFYPSPLHYRIVPELSYDTNATILFGTDTFLAGYAKYAHPYDFYCLRYVFAGAEKLRDETRRVWSQKFGVRILEGYGVTETSPVLAANTPMYHQVGTVGRLLPGIRYQLQEVQGVTDGKRLIVAGPNVMLGYLRATNPGVLEPPPEGWYDTGDIVSMDELGFITIKGRAKRFAKVGGEMVSLTAVENYICELWPDKMHAVVSIPDVKKGEQLVLITQFEDAKRDEIVAYFRKRGISELNIPKKILVLGKLPLLGTGKTDYVQLQRWVLEE